MEVNKSDDWIIPHVCIVLESLYTSGKFADIYRIRYQPKSDSGRNAFVAKVLKCKYFIIIHFYKFLIKRKSCQKSVTNNVKHVLSKLEPLKKIE